MCVYRSNQSNIKSIMIISLCRFPDAISKKKKHLDVIIAKHLGFGLIKPKVS